MTADSLDAPEAIDALKLAIATVETMQASGPEAQPLLRVQLAKAVGRAVAAAGLVQLTAAEFAALVGQELRDG